MLEALRTRPCFALATLAAFMLVQPAMGCAALCLLERHAAASPSMAEPNHTVIQSDCHHSTTGTVQAVRLPGISPMEPSAAIVIALVPRWTEPVWTLPSTPRFISYSVEPPPPRLA